MDETPGTFETMGRRMDQAAITRVLRAAGDWLLALVVGVGGVALFLGGTFAVAVVVVLGGEQLLRWLGADVHLAQHTRTLLMAAITAAVALYTVCYYIYIRLSSR
jgi:hypothetical protein